MGILGQLGQRLRAGWQAMANGAVSGSGDDGHWLFRHVGHRTHASVPVNETLALNLPAVWACTTLIADTMAQLPLDVVRRVGRRREDQPGHPIAELFAGSANEDASSGTVVNTGTIHTLLWGNGFLEVERSRRTREPVGLWPLLPDRTRLEVRRDGSSRQVVFNTSIDGVAEVVPARDVLHLKGYSFDGLTGISPVSVARQAIGLGLAMEEFGGKFFANDAKSGGFLMHPGKLGEKAVRNLTESMGESGQGGREGWHKPKILEEGMRWQSTTIPPEDAQFLGSREFQIAEICRIYRVPLILVQSHEKTTCLPAGTKVATEAGPANIEDVKAGTKVWSFNGQSMELQRVGFSQMTGIAPIYTIKTRSRTLRCTGNHRVLVRRKFAAPRAGIGGHRAVEWRNVWVHAAEITDQDYLVAPLEFGGDAEEAPNGRRLTAAFMEFCGLYTSDGSMSDAHISIARDGAASYMAHYRQCMLREFHAARKGGHKAWDEREPVSVVLREGHRDTRFSSKGAVQELRDLGFSGTAHTKRIPAWVFGLSRRLQLAFLRGMVDGDGYVNEDGWITWSSCSEDLLEDIRQLLMMTGIPCGRVMRYAQTGGAVINGREVDRGPIFQLWSCSKEHNRLIGTHDERYRDRLAGDVTTRASCWSPDFMGRGPKGSRPGEAFDLPGRLMKVLSIDVSRVCQPVYDLGVEGTHSFIADGVIVHNSWGSGIEQLMIGFIRFTMVPWVMIWEQEIARKLLTEAERKAGFYVKFNTNALLRGDMAARQAFYAGGIQNGWLMPNEVREKEDMEPLPGLDRPAPSPRTPPPGTDEDMPDESAA